MHVKFVQSVVHTECCRVHFPSKTAIFPSSCLAVLQHYYDGFDYGSLANVPNSLRGKKNIVFGNLKKILEFNKS